MAKKSITLENGIEVTEQVYNLLKKGDKNKKGELADYNDLISKGVDPTAAMQAFEAANPSAPAGGKKDEPKAELSYQEMSKSYSSGLASLHKNQGANIDTMFTTSASILNDQITAAEKEIAKISASIRIERKADVKKENEAKVKELENKKTEAEKRLALVMNTLTTLDNKGDIVSQIITIGRTMLPGKETKVEKDGAMVVVKTVDPVVKEAYEKSGRFALTAEGMAAVEDKVFKSIENSVQKLVDIKKKLDSMAGERIKDESFLNPVDEKGVALTGREKVRFYANEMLSLKGIKPDIDKAVMQLLMNAISEDQKAFTDEISSMIGMELKMPSTTTRSSGGSTGVASTIDTKNVTILFPDGTNFGREVEWVANKGYIKDGSDFKDALIKYCENNTTVKDFAPENSDKKLNNCYFSSAENGVKTYICGFEIVGGKYNNRKVLTPTGNGTYSNAFHEGIKANSFSTGENCLIAVAEAFGISGIQFQLDGVTVYTTK